MLSFSIDNMVNLHQNQNQLRCLVSSFTRFELFTTLKFSAILSDLCVHVKSEIGTYPFLLFSLFTKTSDLLLSFFLPLFCCDKSCLTKYSLCIHTHLLSFLVAQYNYHTPQLLFQKLSTKCCSMLMAYI